MDGQRGLLRESQKDTAAHEAKAEEVMLEFTIPYPTTPKGKAVWNRQYGFNAYWAGKHWAKRKADADYWHELTRQAVKGLPPLTDFPVVITMYFNDRMDSINHAAIFKMIEDALKGSIIPDDSRRYVCGSEIYFHDADYIKVAIKKSKKI